LADRRGGLPGSADERTGIDAAAAFCFGDDGVIAELLGCASATAEFLDRWAQPGDLGSHTWEERFGEGEYLPLAERAVEDVLKATGLTMAEVGAVVVAGPNARAVKSAASSLRKQADLAPDPADLTSLVGNGGTASLGLALADALDTAGADDVILALSLADGADAMLLRTTDLLATRRPAPIRDSLGDGMVVGYPTYLMWRGLLSREGPRRPHPVRPSAPFSARDIPYKFAFVGGRCRQCSTVQFPLPDVCLRCQARNSCDPISGAGAIGTIATYTVDRLAYSPNPPLVSAVIDLEVGGRVTVEVADIPIDSLEVGLEVKMTFRRLMTADGVHNYFWKAGPR
jgi:uncharacterized OB-fold protein